jgi:thiol-disulfide isomerase/thioredoxin
MFKKLLIAFLFVSFISNAQYSVKGELQRHQNYPWMVLYQLKGSEQNYIAYDSIKKGQFSIAIPANQAPGVYRLMYDVKNQAYIDFIFDNENIELTFNPKNPNETVQFSESENNKAYQNYLRAVAPIQQALDSLQVTHFTSQNKAKVESSYGKKISELNVAQSSYEKLATNKLASHFIKASKRFYEVIPVSTPEDYLSSVQLHFFDNISFDSKELQTSTFIHDKINEFIFYLHSADDPAQITKLRKESITTILNKIGTNFSLSKDIQEGLLHAFAEQENITLVNFMLNNYLRLPRDFQDTNFINDIKAQLKTSIGVTVPNISWQENGLQKNLHSLRGAEKYVVVFWSSTCGHCLQEMPVLYNFLKAKTNVKVIAIGLEDETSKTGWQAMIKQYPNFLHVYGKDKWNNSYASDYGVNATPSFFVLDAQKKILAKPDYAKDLKAFFGE